jgi:hypothetical protein
MDIQILMADFSVLSVLESSCTSLYTAVLRAETPGNRLMISLNLHRT